MQSVLEGSLLQPGKDAHEHAQALQQNIIQPLAVLTGGPVNSGSLAPVQDQDVASEDLKHLMEDPQPKVDLADIKSGIEGNPRIENSKQFLATFLARLKKKHPDHEAVEKT